MLETLSVRPRICQQIRSGPLGRWVDEFVDVLASRGYTSSVIRRHVRAAAIFGAWLERQQLAATEIDEPLVTRFISGLPRRRHPTRRHGQMSAVAGGVRLLAMHLWTRGVAPPPGPVVVRDEAELWLQRFDDHLVHVHGLVVGTRRMYGRYAAALLAECAGTPTPDWSGLTVPAVAAFVQTRASQLCPSARRSPVTATRAFLRFLAMRGVVPAGIEGAVPTIREWRHASLPRALTADDVKRVLAAVDETRPSGRRDRAILLLLSRLGLRAAEAAALTAKDVDWHNGTVRVAGKGGRERQLPLPADVGESLVATLRSRPPTSPSDVIFVTAAGAVSATQRGGRDGHRHTGVASRRRYRPAARRPRVPTHPCVADGPPGCPDEDRRGPARPCPPGDHRHLREAGSRNPGDDRPALAPRWTMTGEAWRQHLQTYVALRRAIGFTMQREARLLQDFVEHLERRGDDAPVVQGCRRVGLGERREPARAAVEHRARVPLDGPRRRA